MKKQILLILSILFIPYVSYSATGDVLFKCTFDEPGTTPQAVVQSCGGNGLSTMNTIATIDPTGGHDGGKAISYYFPYTDGGHDQGGYFWTSAINKPEITVEYWEKFDVPETTSNYWNVKSARIYNGSDFIGGMMGRWSGGASDPRSNRSWNEGHLGTNPTTTLTITKYVDYVLPNAGYCTSTSNPLVYSCPNNQMALHFTPDAGTNWRKIRIHIKSPTTPGVTPDGAIHVWINDQLAYTLSNIIGTSTMSPNVTGINFHPSDDYFVGGTGSPFHHLYDDITVYDGFVPPAQNSLLAPTGLNVVTIK